MTRSLRRSCRDVLTGALALGIWLTSMQGMRAQPGNAITFDGTDDYVTIAADPDIQISGTTLTLEAWVYASAWETNVTDGVVLAMEDADNEGYKLSVGNGGQVNFAIANGSAWSSLTTGAVLTLDRWHHLAGVYNGSTMYIYVDGKLSTSSAVSITLSPAENPLILGSSFDYIDSRLLQGRIDEVRIWNTARTQDQLLDYMYQLLVGNESGLAAYYRMSDGSGTSLTDNGPNGLTGTLTLGPTWSASDARIASSAAVANAFRRPGTGLTFGGTDEYVNVPDNSSLNPTTGLSVEAWINAASTSGSPRIVSKASSASSPTQGYSLHINASARLVGEIRTSSALYTVTANSPAPTITTSSWFHVAMTWSQGGVLTLYINGRSVATSATTAGTLTNTASALSIARGAYNGNYFTGQVDEVRIWNDARTAQEIQENMFRTLEGTESGLVAHYQVDDATGTSLTDQTSNANTGTLTNMETSDWTDASGWEASKVWTAGGNWSDFDTWLVYTIPNSTTASIYAFRNLVMDNSVNGGLFTIASGTTVTFTSGFTLTLARDMVNHGTTTGAGGLTLNGSAAIQLNGTGSTTIGTFDSNNASGVTLGKSITVDDELRLSRGALTIGANTITVNEQITRTSGSFTGSTSSNMVIGEPTGAATDLPAVTLNNLTVLRENGIILTGNVTVNNTLTMTNTQINVSDFFLILNSAATISGTFSANNKIVAETLNGGVRKFYSGTGSFLFPIGDQTGYYTPITLNFTSGSFASGYAQVSLQILKQPNNPSATHYINRYWTVSASGITSFSCDITAIYDEFDIVGDEDEYWGGKWDGSAWALMNECDPLTNTITGTVSSFSDFTAGEAAEFPVEWLSFTAAVQSGGIQLDWATATETNADRFELERSGDTRDWSVVSRHKAAGNSSDVRTYSTLDETPLAGANYYRLRQVDLDGKFSYSNVVSAAWDRPVMQVYPNPTSSELYLGNLSGRTLVTIQDMSGRTLHRADTDAGELRLDVSQYPAGSYVLMIKSKGKKPYSLIWEKQ
ncbi:MAG: LamG-like jellyroll fold domain-containing protein [Bacteroidia bacterium]|nr:LamG-like jellyroll fold domain-containing protein [Bacteroidia bacterium]